MDLPVSAYVILGFLRLGPLDEARHGPRSGYDVKRAADLSVRWFWSISPVQIYPTLKQLERAGLVRGRDEPRGARERRVYELTRAGEEELRDWLRRDDPLTMTIRDLGVLKLFFADALPPEEAVAILRGIRARAERAIEYADRNQRPAARISEQKGDRFPMIALRLGYAIHTAFLEFCRDAEAELHKRRRQAARTDR